jgi:pimeloyl-ACP methyl ester carboxylesterase
LITLHEFEEEEHAMAQTAINGTKIWYEVGGDGPALLQFHGLGLGHANFSAVTPMLRKHFRVVDWDMRGFGDSDKPAPPYTLETWAEDAVALLDHLHLDRADVHGTSMGGMVALVFAEKYPTRVRRMVIGCCMARYDTMAILNKVVWKALARATGMSPEVATLVATQAFSRQYLDRPEAHEVLQGMVGAFAKNDPNLWIHFCEVLEATDLEPLLGRITTPTLILSGDSDIMTPVESGPRGVGTRRMAEIMPNATLQLIKGCGHLHLAERPEESVEAIVRFLMGV